MMLMLRTSDVPSKNVDYRLGVVRNLNVFVNRRYIDKLY